MGTGAVGQVSTPAVKSSPPPAQSTAKPASPASSQTQSPSSNQTSGGSSATDSRSEPKDTFEASAPEERESGRVESLVKGLEDSFRVDKTDKDQEPKSDSGSASPERQSDPRASLFKDEQRLEKLDSARTDLKAAEKGTHRKLEALRKKHVTDGKKELRPQTQELEDKQERLEDARLKLEKTRDQAKKRIEEAPERHREAQERDRNFKESLRQTQTDDGKNLYSDLGSTVRTLRDAPGQIKALKSVGDPSSRRTGQAIERKTKEFQEAKKHLDELKGDPRFGKTVQNFLKNRRELFNSNPQRVADQARTAVGKAQAQVQKAESQVDEAQKSLDSSQDRLKSQQAQEMAGAKKELISELKSKVQDLSSIEREDLSDGITKSSAFGVSKGPFEAKLTEDGLQIKNGGRDVSVKPGEKGTLQLESSYKHQNGQVGARESEMVRDSDGAWRESKSEARTWKNSADANSGKEPQSKSQTQNFKDGSSLTVSRSSHRGGKSRWTKQSRRVRDVNGNVTTDSHTKYSDGDTRDVHSETRKDGTSIHSNRYTNKDGSYWNEKTTIKDSAGTETKTESTYSESNREKGVPGLGWVPNDSAEDLRQSLGEDRRYGTITTTGSRRSKDGKSEYISDKRHLWSSKDGKRNLELQKGKNGAPDTYTFNRQDGDRELSQVFSPGSNDTTVTKSHTDKDGFRVTETLEDRREFAKAVKEQTGKTVAAGGESTTLTKSQAKADDLHKLMGKLSGLDRLGQSDAVKEFLGHVGKGSFDLAGNQGLSTNDAGKQDENELFKPTNNAFQSHSQVMATAPDGSRLVMRHDSKTGKQVAQFVRPGEEGKDDYSALSMQANQGGQRLEVNSEGKAEMVGHHHTAGDIRSALKNTDFVGTQATKGSMYTAQFARKLSRIGHAADESKDGVLKGLKALDKGYGASFAAGFDGVSSVLSFGSAISDGMKGEYSEAFRHSAQGFSDFAGIAKLGVEKGGKLGAAARLGTKLGIVGAAISAGYAYQDFSEGKHLRGAFNVIGAGGSIAGLAASLYGGSSWLGPVGWVAATVGTVGVLSYDYYDSTSIAQPVPGLLN